MLLKIAVGVYGLIAVILFLATVPGLMRPVVVPFPPRPGRYRPIPAAPLAVRVLRLALVCAIWPVLVGVPRLERTWLTRWIVREAVGDGEDEQGT